MAYITIPNNGKKNISIEIYRDKVLEEVAQKSGYTGAKMVSENDMLDQIQTVDEDNDELVMFFDELRSMMAITIGESLLHEGYREGEGEAQHQYGIDIIVPAKFNEAILDSLRTMLFNYFVYGVLAKWYEYTNKEEAAAYYMKADEYIERIKSNTQARTFARRSHPF